MKDFDLLTERGKIRRYRSVLIQALEEYVLEDVSIRFISNESKPVFRVSTSSGSFAAKFHNPKEHTHSQMASELDFLAYVSRDSGLRIETPLANREGSFITEVRSSLLPDPVAVALCSWVPGAQLKSDVSARSYERLGRCAALLHKASSVFRPGRGFHILTNDTVFYWDKETIISKHDDKLLPKHRQDVFRKSVQFAEDAIAKVWKSGKPIVIHNDLHPCNIKLHKGDLSMYDFEDITWGFPQQDIGTAMYYIRFRDDYIDLLAAFRAGYEQVLPWPLDSEDQLDRFVAARILMLANYVVNFNLRPKKHLPEFEKKLRMLIEKNAA